MSIRDTIKTIEKSMPTCVVFDQEKSCESILSARAVVFLDTCFLSAAKFYTEHIIRDTLSMVTEKVNKRQVVFVLTELVIYEARDPRNNKIQSFVTDVISILDKMGFPVVVLNEENVCGNMAEYFSRGMDWWNELLITRLRENKPYLSKLVGVIHSDKSGILSDNLELNATQLKDSKLIEKVISQLKERKSDGDSLAEELICIIIFFVFECFMNAPKKKVVFCSLDNQALARLRMVISNSYGKAACFENIHLFSFTQYMVRAGIITDKQKAKSILSKTMPDNIRVVEKKELPFCENEQMLSLSGIIDGMFAGRLYQYRGN